MTEENAHKSILSLTLTLLLGCGSEPLEPIRQQDSHLVADVDTQDSPPWATDLAVEAAGLVGDIEFGHPGAVHLYAMPSNSNTISSLHLTDSGTWELGLTQASPVCRVARLLHIALNDGEPADYCLDQDQVAP